MACGPSEDSDQCEHPLIRDFAGWLRTQACFMQTAKTLIRLGGCPGWSESSLGARANLLVLSCAGSYGMFSDFLDKPRILHLHKQILAAMFIAKFCKKKQQQKTITLPRVAIRACFYSKAREVIYIYLFRYICIKQHIAIYVAFKCSLQHYGSKICHIQIYRVSPPPPPPPQKKKQTKKKKKKRQKKGGTVYKLLLFSQFLDYIFETSHMYCLWIL